MLLKAICSIAIVICTIVFPASAGADGLIYQLPANGSWIEYDIEWIQLDADGKVEKQGKKTLKISSVGREIVDDEACRWIETKQIIKRSDKPDFIELFKLLIPEKRLVRGEAPLDHVVRAWTKIGGLPHPQTGVVLDWANAQPTSRVVPSLKNNANLNHDLAGPLPQLEHVEPMLISSGLGRLSCACDVGTSMSKDKSNPIQFTRRIKTWLNDEVPFGVVKVERELEQTSPKKTRRTLMTYNAIKKGDHAMSEIPDSK